MLNMTLLLIASKQLKYHFPQKYKNPLNQIFF